MSERALAEVAERLEFALGVVDAADEGVLVCGAASRLGDISAHGVVEVHERVLAHAGHEGISRLLHRRVERDGKRELLWLVGKAHDLRDDAAGGDRKVTRADAASIRGVESAERLEGGVVVHEGLALAHEDDARDTGAKVGAHVHDLLVDLGCREGAREPGPAGRAEGAAHGAPRLGRGADGESVARGHADALDAHAVGEAQEVLPAPIYRGLAGNLLDAPER